MYDHIYIYISKYIDEDANKMCTTGQRKEKQIDELLSTGGESYTAQRTRWAKKGVLSYFSFSPPIITMAIRFLHYS